VKIALISFNVYAVFMRYFAHLQRESIKCGDFAQCSQCFYECPHFLAFFALDGICLTGQAILTLMYGRYSAAGTLDDAAG
jgi:hypothetical protein